MSILRRRATGGANTAARRYELFVCGLRGHVTHEPTGSDEGAIRLRGHLQVMAYDETWRCLRCGLFVPGKPAKTKGPVPPQVRRGLALRQMLITRVIAVERLVRCLVLAAAAYAIYRFHRDQVSLQALFAKDWPIISHAAAQLHVNLDSDSQLISRVLSLNSHTITLIIVLVAVYGAVEGVEGIGLWLMKRWGEYVAAIATGIFLLPEAWELLHHATVIKIIGFGLNLAVVIYLIQSKRLFGLRGGRAAYEAQFAAESLTAPPAHPAPA